MLNKIQEKVSFIESFFLEVDQCGDADLCEVSNVRLRIMGWP